MVAHLQLLRKFCFVSIPSDNCKLIKSLKELLELSFGNFVTHYRQNLNAGEKLHTEKSNLKKRGNDKLQFFNPRVLMLRNSKMHQQKARTLNTPLNFSNLRPLH
jgi:hypothetical protein